MDKKNKDKIDGVNIKKGTCPKKVLIFISVTVFLAISGFAAFFYFFYLSGDNFFYKITADFKKNESEVPVKRSTNSANSPVLNRSEIKVKDLNGGGIWALDRLEYTILVRNTGDSDAKSIEVCCPIPAGMGYVTGSASNGGIVLDQNGITVKWIINNIDPGEVIKLTFQVFIAEYVTYGEKIKTDFYIRDGERRVKLDNPVIDVNQVVFETIVCMGDSLTALTGYPEIMSKILEKKFPHANFNVIELGVKSEMANQAIFRFDKDIRVHNPDIIILGYGANDAGAETGYFRYYMDVLVKQSLSTGAKVFVFGVGYIDTTISKWANKSNYTVFNEILKNDICPKNGAVYIDLFSEMSKEPSKYIKSDGMHWNKEGANLAANIIAGTLVDYMDKDGKIIPSSSP